MTLPINPYIAGNPVGGSPAFIGRADVLREVLRVLRRPAENAIVLYGQRRIGKTSVLQQLEAQLPQAGPYRPVYFDLQDKAEWPLARVLQTLARTIAHALGQPEPDLGDDAMTAFRSTWLPQVLAALPPSPKGEAGPISLVLLFDEFDVLADPQGQRAAGGFFPYLRELMGDAPDRLQFVFAIGRNIDDLDTIALSLFKGTPYRRVSLLSKEDTAALIRLSEANHTLYWTEEAVARVWDLTHGHPFLTQQLGSHVWERAYDDDPERAPSVTLSDVDAAAPEALEASRNTLEWLWDGLGPAERVVASALAEAGPGPITREKLDQVLYESGVRIIIRELENAPQLLQEWDLIEPADGGYCFRVELLRRWLVEHKPLRRVQDELDRVEPVSNSLYEAASGFYRSGDLEQAVPLLRQAVGLNPNHVRANQLLADILIAKRQYDEAQRLLERLYDYHPAAARPGLIQVLLEQAESQEDDEARLRLYDQVLALSPAHPEAATRRRAILRGWGDEAARQKDFEAALVHYRRAGLSEKVAEMEYAIRRRDLEARLAEVETLEAQGRYEEALKQARALANEITQQNDLEAMPAYYQKVDFSAKVAELEQTDFDTRMAEVEALEAKGHYEKALAQAHALASDYADMRDDWPAILKRLKENIQLSPWNPLDYSCLLWWILVTPQYLKMYLEIYGENAEKRVGIWLTSTLIWLPLFELTLGMGLGTLPQTTEEVFSSSTYLMIALGLPLFWLLTCFVESNLIDKGCISIMMTLLTVFSVTVVMAVVVAGVIADVVAGVMTVIMAIVVAYGVAVVVAGVVTVILAGVVAYGVAVGVPVGVAFGVEGARGIVAGVVAGVVTVIIAIVVVGVAADVEESLKTGQPSWLARGAFIALALSHAFLIWFSFLGGWRVFAS